MAALAYPAALLRTPLRSTSGEPPQLGFTFAKQFAQHAPVAPWACSGGVAVGDGAYGRKLHKSSGRDDAEGSLTPPCLRIGTHGRLEFRRGVAAGSRTVTVQVKQPLADEPRPRMRVVANAAIGVATNLTATATSATGWQELSLTFTASADGGILILLETMSLRGCYFDRLRVL